MFSLEIPRKSRKKRAKTLKMKRNRPKIMGKCTTQAGHLPVLRKNILHQKPVASPVSCAMGLILPERTGTHHPEPHPLSGAKKLPNLFAEHFPEVVHIWRDLPANIESLSRFRATVGPILLGLPREALRGD